MQYKISGFRNCEDCEEKREAIVKAYNEVVRTDDDAVSREAARERLGEICEKYHQTYGDDYGCGFGYELYHAFDDLPSATSDAVSRELVEAIREKCLNAVDRIPITFSRNDADECLKRDISDIFDRHIGKERE